MHPTRCPFCGSANIHPEPAPNAGAEFVLAQHYANTGDLYFDAPADGVKCSDCPGVFYYTPTDEP